MKRGEMNVVDSGVLDVGYCNHKWLEPALGISAYPLIMFPKMGTTNYIEGFGFHYRNFKNTPDTMAEKFAWARKEFPGLFTVAYGRILLGTPPYLV